MRAAGGIPQLLSLALFHVLHPEEAIDSAEGVDDNENAADERADLVLRGPESRARQGRNMRVRDARYMTRSPALSAGHAGQARIAPRAHNYAQHGTVTCM